MAPSATPQRTRIQHSNKPLYSDDLMRVVGANVRELRERQGLSKLTFSLMVGIGRPMLDKIEAGIADIRLSYLVKLADGLGVQVEELMHTNN